MTPMITTMYREGTPTRPAFIEARAEGFPGYRQDYLHAQTAEWNHRTAAARMMEEVVGKQPRYHGPARRKCYGMPLLGDPRKWVWIRADNATSHFTA